MATVRKVRPHPPSKATEQTGKHPVRTDQSTNSSYYRHLDQSRTASDDTKSTAQRPVNSSDFGFESTRTAKTSLPAPVNEEDEGRRLTADEQDRLDELDEIVKLKRNTYNNSPKLQREYRALLAKRAGVEA